MNHIRSEMSDASYSAGCTRDLSRFFADELRSFAAPCDAEILTGWIEKTRDDFVKVSAAAASALQNAPKSSDAPHSLCQMADAMMEFALTRCKYPAGMTQEAWRSGVLDVSNKLQGCADGILSGDRQVYADLKISADFLRRHFKYLQA